MQSSSSKINPSEILDAIPGGFFIYHADGDEELIYANKELLVIFGCDTFDELKQLTHNSFRGLVHPEDLDTVEESIFHQIHENSRNLDYVEYRIIRKDGEIRWLEDFGHLMHHELWGDIFYVFVSDITEKRTQHENAVKQAADHARQHDPFTGLYTREFFCLNADRIIHENPDKKYAILIVEIENFKFITEVSGIEAGNKILKLFTDSGSDLIPGYVIGGRAEDDSFVALLEIQTSSDDTLESLCQINSHPAVSNLSLKHGLYEVSEDIPASIMCSRALLALNSIKGIYGTNVKRYDDSIRADWLYKQRIVEAAEESLKSQHFQVYYQPKFDLVNNRVNGAEALVRWHHPVLGFIHPSRFIPVFEENGFIQVMDAYIRETVCRTLSRWRDAGMTLIPVSVNISRRDFDAPDFVDTVIAVTDKYQLDRSLLHLEITESCYSENPEKISACVQALHDAGFIIELDDFGTGYSSLAMLNSMPLDILKIDRGIIQEDVPGSQRNILEFIMQLADMMNLKTVQEGVETENQLQRVRSLGCDYVQGYYYSKPLPLQDFEKYLTVD